MEPYSVKTTYEAYTGTPKTGVVDASAGSDLNILIGKAIPGTIILKLSYAAAADAGTNSWVKVKYNGLKEGARFGNGVVLAAEKHDVLIKTDVEKVSGKAEVIVIDDGSGGLMCNGRKLKGDKVDYSSGRITLPSPASAGLDIYVQSSSLQSVKISEGAKAYDFSGGFKTISNIHVALAGGTYSFIDNGDTKKISITETPSNITANVSSNEFHGCRPVFDSWVFDADGLEIIERGGTLYKEFDGKTGIGKPVGSIDGVNGKVTLSDTSLNLKKLNVVSGIVSDDENPIYQFSGRAPSAPVRPESFTVHARGWVAL